MAEASIPVNLTNPGQVFACLGFLEAAEVLMGDAQGGFDWADEKSPRFLLSAAGQDNPFERVLEFLSKSEIEEFEPSEVFPAKHEEKMALPIRIGNGGVWLELSHWCDGSGLEKFKLYAGNRSAKSIASSMIGVIVNLWTTQRTALASQPFDVLAPMGGSFNFDPRGAWTAIDAGYSPNDQGHLVVASPVVELLAAWGLQHTRPIIRPVRQVRYAVWRERLAVELARIALQAALPCLDRRLFRFELALSGKNKVVTPADEEALP
jgi:CRISPR-associated protein Csx14